MNNKLNTNIGSPEFFKAAQAPGMISRFQNIGFETVGELLPIRIYDLLNLNTINNVVAGEMLLALYRYLNSNDFVDQCLYEGTLRQPYRYTAWHMAHPKYSSVTVGDLVLEEDINQKALFHLFNLVSKAFYKSEEYNPREYCYRDKYEYEDTVQSLRVKEGRHD